MTLRVPKSTKIILTAGIVLLLLVAILPLLYISRYSHPCADDYTYGTLTHTAWTETHSISATVQQAFAQVKSSYNTWQGTYSSIFLMSLSPAVFEDSVSYGISAVIMLSMLLASVYCITYSIFVKIFHSTKWHWFFVASLAAFWMIESMHSPVNGIYWFNGSVHYCFMHSVMMFMITCALNYMVEKKNKNHLLSKIIFIIIAALLTIICGGANYSTALLGLCLLGLLFLADCFMSRKFSLLALPIVSYIVAFIISVIAPGNSVRSSNFDGQSPAKAIIEAIKLAFKDDMAWSDLQLVIIIIMALPILYAMAKSVTVRIKWWMPIVSIVLSFLLHSVLNVPLFFAMGGGAVARQENICKFWFQLMVMLNAFLIVCAIIPLTQKFENKLFNSAAKQNNATKKAELNLLPLAIIFYIFMLGIMLVHIKTSTKTLYQYSTYVAYSQYRSGEITEYESTYRSRLEIINSDATDIVLPAYTAQPYLLYFDDITPNPYDWRNQTFARWYGKSSVYTE